MGEVLTVFLGVVGAGVIGLARARARPLVLPLLATQILWINLITDSGPALAMGVDPQTDDVMARPPRRPSERAIDARMWWGVVVDRAGDGAGDPADDRPLPARRADRRRRATSPTRAPPASRCWCSRSCSTASTPARRRRARSASLFVNRWLWGAIALSVLLQVAVVHVQLLNVAFGTVPLTPAQWVVCVAMASTVLWFGELRKAVIRGPWSKSNATDPGRR